ncbi:MAG: M48 family metallopeptidase [Spirochaetota bacterium]|nr:MAG: M48 family metallopeptidase [Spirochaetota bacterium]
MDIHIDRILRSKRRTVSIEVTREAHLIVRAPLRAPSEEIEEFVEKKRLWIIQKQREAEARLERATPKSFIDDENFYFLGNTYPLKIVDNGEPALTFDTVFRLSREYLKYARELFITWYKEQAYKKIGERLHHFSSLSDIDFNKFRITNAQRRWGSCNIKSNIFFSWRLIMAPIPVVDYVVVHELVHIEEKSHSHKFWNGVAEILPDYRLHRQWLKENGYLLVL